MQSSEAGQIDGSGGREIVHPQRSGQDFLLRWALPNVFFHLTAAYALLRHAGSNSARPTTSARSDDPAPARRPA